MKPPKRRAVLKFLEFKNVKKLKKSKTGPGGEKFTKT